MAYKYSLKRSRRDKRRNTRRHHGGRGGVLETGATQSAMVSNPAPFSGGKRRGMPIAHLHKTRKNKKH